MMCQKRAQSGKFGAPSYIMHVRAARERAVDDVAVAGHPADVGRAPVEVVVAQVEDVLAS